MIWIDKINQVITYLEEHLEAEIDYTDICHICSCSLPKVQQLFSVTCGTTMSEYIRSRRMTIAAYELLHTELKVIDLAYRFGYESPEAFTRAYQMFHGISPTITRKTGAHEEYHRITVALQVYGGKNRMGTKPIVMIETGRCIIRKFKEEDWKDLQEIARSNAASEFADCDCQWPAEDEEIKKVCSYFVGEHQYWAVEQKESRKVICFINFNYIDEKQSLDIGHIINRNELGKEYEYEVLKALYNYAFMELGVKSIHANWPYADHEKLEPLFQLGMKVVDRSWVDKFQSNPNGTKSKFEACTVKLTREEWITNPAQ